jgi:hypothetical protein
MSVRVGPFGTLSAIPLGAKSYGNSKWQIRFVLLPVHAGPPRPGLVFALTIEKATRCDQIDRGRRLLEQFDAHRFDCAFHRVTRSGSFRRLASGASAKSKMTGARGAHSQGERQRNSREQRRPIGSAYARRRTSVAMHPSRLFRTIRFLMHFQRF